MALLDDYYSESQLADELDVKPRTLKKYRDDRTGPPVTYIRGKPNYRKESTRNWLLAKEGKGRAA